MDLTLADLGCSACSSYVHPFLDRCPGCGLARESNYRKALADGPGLPSLLDDERLQRAAHDAAMKRALLAFRSGGIAGAMSGFGGRQSSPTTPEELEELTDAVASSVTYRGAGLPGAHDSTELSLHAARGALRVADQQGHVLVVVDPTLVMAATPIPRGTRGLAHWSGISFEGLVELRTPAVDGDGLLLTWRSLSGYSQLTLGNRRGMFASKGRTGHYEDLARWLGVLAAIVAEARWREIGAEAYAVELGLKVAPQGGVRLGSSAAGAASAGGGSSAAGTSAAGDSARERLAELEALRVEGLVTEAEYAQKRREILDRL